MVSSKSFTRVLSSSRKEKIRNRRDMVPESEVDGVNILLHLERDVHEEYFYSFDSERRINAKNEGHSMFAEFVADNIDELSDKSAILWYEERREYTMTNVEVTPETKQRLDEAVEYLQEEKYPGVSYEVALSAVWSNALPRWSEVFGEN